MRRAGHKAPADRMWNLDRKETGGKLEVLCGRDSHEARRRGLRVYRLAETLRRDAEREAERKQARDAREQYFARFGNARLSDAITAAEKVRGERNGNGHQPQSSSARPQPAPAVEPSSTAVEILPAS